MIKNNTFKVVLFAHDYVGAKTLEYVHNNYQDDISHIVLIDEDLFDNEIYKFLKDKKNTLPCAAFLSGEYGVKNLYAGVPVIIGKNGVEKVIEVDLSSEEKINFKKSIKAVEELYSAAVKIDSTLGKV